MPLPNHPDLIVGTDNSDDAAVWKNPDGGLSILSIDAFTPIVDDPKLFGAIAAANAASDIYAMGGTPKFAVNIVVWPEKKLEMDLLLEVIKGGNETAKRGGWLVVGGHTISGAEPIYGQAVYGEVAPKNLLTNANAQPDQALILTKPLGMGMITTALKASAQDSEEIDASLLDVAFEQACQLMLRLNNKAAEVAQKYGATAATDITGFGLLGHLHKLALASGVFAKLKTSNIPTIEGVLELLEYSPGGTQKNLDFVKGSIENFADTKFANTASAELKILADPQTSGGLLFCCPKKNAPQAVEELTASGEPAFIVGELTSGEAGKILLV